MRFIYIHIPKCGGTSISSFLEQRLLPQDITLNLSPHEGWEKYLQIVQKKFGLHKHSTAREIAKAMEARHFKLYYPFTFCRNPFARAYSIYKFTLRTDARHRSDSRRYEDIKDMSFEEFLDSKYMRERQIFAARLQSDWVRDAPVEIHHFRLENVDRQIPELSRKFYGAESGMAKVPRKNYSARRDEWKNMSEKAEQSIVSLYDEDFDTFSYSRVVPR